MSAKVSESSGAAVEETRSASVLAPVVRTLSGCKGTEEKCHGTFIVLTIIVITVVIIIIPGR